MSSRHCTCIGLKCLSCEGCVKLPREMYKMRRYGVLDVILDELLNIMAGKSHVIL